MDLGVLLAQHLLKWQGEELKSSLAGMVCSGPGCWLEEAEKQLCVDKGVARLFQAGLAALSHSDK